jgi:hypothetical protein
MTELTPPITGTGISEEPTPPCITEPAHVPVEKCEPITEPVHVPVPVEKCTTITEDALLTLIHENQYIQSCSSNKKKDVNSLSSLITRDLSQSDCIKLGNGVEKFFIDLIMKFTSYTNIKEKNKKGEKEKDHLFCDEEKKVIYYAELKANLNLDTEKSMSTYTKCIAIAEGLKTEYPEYTINWCLLGLRQLTYHDMPTIIQKKYSTIKDNLFGINQYLTMLNIDLRFNIETYTSLLNNIANAMFD